MNTTFACAALFHVDKINAQSPPPSSEANPKETFKVTSVPTENGSYTISPKIGKDSTVPAGTVLRIKATPQSGYKLDAVYDVSSSTKASSGLIWYDIA